MTDGGELIGNSQFLAAMVQKSVGGEIYAIQSEKEYSSGYGDTVSVARDEIDSNGNVALAGSSVEDMKAICKADVSGISLEVFDDDVKDAAGAVAVWLYKIQKEER